MKNGSRNLQPFIYTFSEQRNITRKPNHSWCQKYRLESSIFCRVIRYTSHWTFFGNVKNLKMLKNWNDLGLPKEGLITSNTRQFSSKSKRNRQFWFSQQFSLHRVFKMKIWKYFNKKINYQKIGKFFNQRIVVIITLR